MCLKSFALLGWGAGGRGKDVNMAGVSLYLGAHPESRQ